MRTTTIARQIALIAALGFAATAHAQLLGGGRLGGSLGGSVGGMIGGAGHMGGMSGMSGMGVPVTRVDGLAEARRAVRVPDTQSLRNSAALDGSAAGNAAGSGSASVALSQARSAAGNASTGAGSMNELPKLPQLPQSKAALRRRPRRQAVRHRATAA